MKKMNVLLAALTLAATAITPMTSSADEQRVNVSVTYDETYTFRIPEKTERDDGTPIIRIGVENVYVESGHGVQVTVSGDSYKDGSWKLKCGDDEIGYKIEDINGTYYENGDTVLTAFSGSDETFLYINTEGRPSCPGTYSDTLTFTSEITGCAA